MEKAKESKMRSNLELPPKKMTGIMQANPFNVLQSSHLKHLAASVGLDMVDDDGIDEVEYIPPDNNVQEEVEYPSPSELADRDRVLDLEEKWTEVVRRSRGKHPRKLFQ